MLKILPSNISNLIAAGEVVQRPASVVKELIENSVDAGASAITLILSDFGKTNIQIIDNGCGMSKEEAELCFKRHATSKIASEQDLYSILTYGFRGEALPSIAACSQVVLKTKRDNDEIGTEVKIEANEIVSVTPATTPKGTNIQVKNIFYNIPARRKFLKSDSWEYKQIIQEFIRVALTRTEIEFKLIHNSKEIYSLAARTNLKQRIIQLCGKELSKELVDVNTNTSIVNVKGYIGTPQSAKKNQSNQYLFVNNRFFRSPMLHKAILKAYDNLLPDNYSPSYFIYLEIDPQAIDVNIHPSKTEIKFEDENVIFNILTATVKESIGENAFAPAIDFDMEGAPEIPVSNGSFYVPSPPKISYDPLFNPFKEESRIKGSVFEQINAFEQGEPENSSNLSYTSGIFNDSNSAGSNSADRNSLLLANRYLVTNVTSGLMIIDIVRAKERIIYESIREAFNTPDTHVQELLYPQEVELNYQEYIDILPYLPDLCKLGFDIRDNGDNHLIMYGTPASLQDESVSLQEIVSDLLTTISESSVKDFNDQFKDRLALQHVRNLKMNINGFNNTEAGIIIDSLFACSEPYSSPFGHKCITIIPIQEIENKLA